MTDKLKKIELAVQEYHEAITGGYHRGVARAMCIGKIEDILDMHIEKTDNSQNQSPANSV